MAQQRRIRLVSVRIRVRSLASLSGLGIRHCHELQCDIDGSGDDAPGLVHPGDLDGMIGDLHFFSEAPENMVFW